MVISDLSTNFYQIIITIHTCSGLHARQHLFVGPPDCVLQVTALFAPWALAQRS